MKTAKVSRLSTRFSPLLYLWCILAPTQVSSGMLCDSATRRRLADARNAVAGKLDKAAAEAVTGQSARHSGAVSYTHLTLPTTAEV